MLERSAALAPIAPLAGSHHERLDGSGYHRGATATQLGVAARLLAAADATPRHPRLPVPGRDAPAARPGRVGEMVRAGTLEKRTVDAVLEAAGGLPLKLRQGHPAGLTDREVEVLRLIAKGQTNKEIAKALVITEKTAGHHVQHIYAKAGVSTRVGAAMFAMRHDLAGSRTGSGTSEIGRLPDAAATPRP